MTLLDPRANELYASKLYSASIIGHTTAHSARIWIRLYEPGQWTLVVSKQPFSGDLKRLGEHNIAAFLQEQAIQPCAVLSHDFSYASNLTHCFDVAELEPATRYFYAVMTERKEVSRRTELGYGTPRQFHTLAANPEEIVFGFYSCHDHINAGGDVGAWPNFLEQLNDLKADFVIGGGDQIYVDTNAKLGFPDIWKWLKDNKPALLERYRKGRGYDQAGLYEYLLDIYRWYYRVYWNVGALQQVYERFPQYMIWDDHEIMDGWGSFTEKERLKRLSRLFNENQPSVDKMLVNLMWKAACRAYYEYEHSHNPLTPYDADEPDNCQWDYSFAHGPAAFYALDVRGHHDVEKQGDPYLLLGKAQMTRFQNWLQAAADNPACAVLFVISPVPLLHWVDALVNYADLGSVKDDFMDEWDHQSNWSERAVLLRNVFDRLDSQGKLLVFLSGDVHCASAYRLTHERYRKARVYQLTSSAISRKPAPSASMLGISAGGELKGSKGVFGERLFALTGNKNFSLLRVRRQAGGQYEVAVDLCWPGEEAGSTIRKRLILD